jgi:hypothetical protein
MMRVMKTYLRLAIIFTISTFLFWLPFFLKSNLPLWNIDLKAGMFPIFANYDGPNYIIVAKSMYDKEMIRHTFSNPLPLEYYPAHLPLYPMMIAVLDVVLPGPIAMILVAFVGSLLAILMFYKLISEYKLTTHPFFLTVVFMFLPARWLAVRSVGSPEGWFVFFVIACFYFYRKKNLWLAALFGILAQWTKSPGILVFAGFQLYFLYQSFVTSETLSMKVQLLADRLIHKDKLVFYIPNLGRWLKNYLRVNLNNWQMWLIPLSVVPLFCFYFFRTGDFFAYFNSGDNFHLFLPPFSIFSPKGQFWVGEFWLEDVIYIWLIFGLGVLKYFKKNLNPEAFFALIFFASTLFVSHRDISRYIVPAVPFMLLGFEKLIGKREFRWIFLLLLIPVYLYAYNFVLNNVAPVADWTPYL